MNLEEKELIVKAIKSTHGVSKWEEEMWWEKDWQNISIAKKVVGLLVEEIRLEKIENLEKELTELKGENK
jgi:hypothetical protein